MLDEYSQPVPLSKRRLAIELGIGAVVVILSCAGLIRWSLSDTVHTSLRLPDGRRLEAWSPSVFYADVCEHVLYGGIRTKNPPPYTAQYITCIFADAYGEMQLSWREVGETGIYVLTEASAPAHVLLAFDFNRNAIRPGEAFAGHHARAQLIADLHEIEPNQAWTMGEKAAPDGAKIKW